MPRPTQVELFISALAERPDGAGDTPPIAAPNPQQEPADRARTAFWTAIDDTLRLSEWRLNGKPTRLGTTRQSRSG